jgi:hypothetical protein
MVHGYDDMGDSFWFIVFVFDCNLRFAVRLTQLRMPFLRTSAKRMVSLLAMAIGNGINSGVSSQA